MWKTMIPWCLGEIPLEHMAIRCDPSTLSIFGTRGTQTNIWYHTIPSKKKILAMAFSRCLRVSSHTYTAILTWVENIFSYPKSVVVICRHVFLFPLNTNIAMSLSLVFGVYIQEVLERTKIYVLDYFLFSDFGVPNHFEIGERQILLVARLAHSTIVRYKNCDHEQSHSHILHYCLLREKWRFSAFPALFFRT